MSTDRQQAFPVPLNGDFSEADSTSGMELRDYFAAHSISPMLVQAYGSTPTVLAQRAYEIADAMMEVRLH